MSFEFVDVVIELTRRCNMFCEHCLRGDAQNANQQIKYITSLFSRTKFINTLTLTGGEPSLVPQVIEKILECAHVYGVEIGNFYIATNAKNVKPRFVKVVQRLYNYCSDNEISAIEISNDEFHNEPERTNGYYLLKDLEFVRYKWETNSNLPWRNLSGGVFHYESVIDQGRGGFTGLRKRQAQPDDIEFEVSDDGTLRVTDGNIYLNCKGWIIGGCDFSYDTQDDPSFDGRICFVDDFSEDMLREYSYAKENELV